MKEEDGHGKFREHSFAFLVEKDDGLSFLRKRWASKPADELRMAAGLEYDSGIASDIFESALERAGEEGFGSEYWPPGSQIPGRLFISTARVIASANWADTKSW